jgi:hypothetical protein
VPRPSSNRLILMYGLDPVLLETRRLILEHAGFTTESAHNREEFGVHTASKSFDLFIFRHTVPEDQRVELTLSNSNRNTPVFQIPLLSLQTLFLAAFAVPWINPLALCCFTRFEHLRIILRTLPTNGLAGFMRVSSDLKGRIRLIGSCSVAPRGTWLISGVFLRPCQGRRVKNAFI